MRLARYLLLLGATLLLGCGETHRECGRSADCAPGESCIWMDNEEHTGRHTVCRALCSREAACQTRSTCACPDSPLGGRCHLTDGAPLTYADGGTAPIFYCHKPGSNFP